MKTNNRILNFAVAALLTATVSGPGMAQQVTGVLGSPSATTTSATSNCRRLTRNLAA